LKKTEKSRLAQCALRGAIVAAAVLACISIFAAFSHLQIQKVERPALDALQQANRLAQPLGTVPAEANESAAEAANLRGREALLLEHTTWADQTHTRVRIPIERAMQLTVQRGIQLAPQAAARSHLAGEPTKVVTAPLTDGTLRSAP